MESGLLWTLAVPVKSLVSKLALVIRSACADPAAAPRAAKASATALLRDIILDIGSSAT